MKKIAAIVFSLVPLGWGTPAEARSDHSMVLKLERQVRSLHQEFIAERELRIEQQDYILQMRAALDQTAAEADNIQATFGCLGLYVLNGDAGFPILRLDLACYNMDQVHHVVFGG